MAECFYHPDRPGVGVCMRCRRVICGGCCTRLDGVNHCFSCLEELGRPVESRGSMAGETAIRLAAVLGGIVLLSLAFWIVQARLVP
jgi:hypothetical protein